MASDETAEPLASGSSSATKPQKRVQVIGAPPPGPPIPKTELHSDEEEGIADEDEDDAASVDTDAAPTDQPEASTSATRQTGDLDPLANFTSEDEDLDLSHLSLKTADLRSMDLSRFKSHLKRLVLRQNLINKVGSADIGALEALEDLDLYDNSLEKTYGEVLKQCPKIESVPAMKSPQSNQPLTDLRCPAFAL